MRSTFQTIIVGLVTVVVANTAWAGPVTWAFAGEVWSVSDSNNIFVDNVVPGSPVAGYYTFESSTPGDGLYIDVVTAFAAFVGEIPVRGPSGTYNTIRVYDNFPAVGVDHYSMLLDVSVGVLDGFVSLGLRDPTGGLISAGALPLVPPSLEGLLVNNLFLGTASEDFSINAALTSLSVIPEPGTLLLVAIGSLLFATRFRSSNCSPKNTAYSREKEASTMIRKGISGYAITLLLTGISVVRFTPAAVAGPVRFEFEGTITSIADPSNLLGGAVSVGSPFSGIYFFDSATADARASDPDRGTYTGAIIAVGGVIGPVPFVGTLGNESYIDINQFFNGNDTYQVYSPIALLAVPDMLNMFITLKDLSGSAFLNDSLPVTPPDLQLFDSAAFSIGATSEILSVNGRLTSLIPEPGSVVLLGVGCPGLLMRSRKRLRHYAIDKTQSQGKELSAMIRPAISRYVIVILLGAVVAGFGARPAAAGPVTGKSGTVTTWHEYGSVAHPLR